LPRGEPLARVLMSDDGGPGAWSHWLPSV
jgi:hypothetical protein